MESSLANATSDNATWLTNTTRIALDGFDPEAVAEDGAGLKGVTGCERLSTPSTVDLLADLGTYLVVLWAVVAVLVLVLYGMLARCAVLINKYAPKEWRRHIIWVNSIYPFVCLSCLGSLIVPASDTFLNGVGIIYMSIGIAKFLDLCLLYFGGETRLLTSVGDAHLPLASPPVCCCCFPCCPHVRLQKSGLRLMKTLVYQLQFTQTAYFVVTLYLNTAGVYIPGQTTPTVIFVCFTIFNVVSFMSAMYGLSMFIRATRDHPPHHHYRAKAGLMRFTLMVVKIQELIFGIAINNGGVSCTASMSPKVFGAFIQNIVTVLEMVVLGLLAYRMYSSGAQYTSRRPSARGQGDAAERPLTAKRTGNDNN